MAQTESGFSFGGYMDHLTYLVNITTANSRTWIGSVQCSADNVEPYIHIELEDESEECRLCLTIHEANLFINALQKAIADAKSNKP